MIIDTLKTSQRIEVLNPYFKKVFDYIKTHDLASVPAGKIEIAGADACIIVVDHPGKTIETAKLESHNDFLDVHIPLSAPETLGWTPRADVPEMPYDATGDCSLYEGKAQIYTTILPGQLIVFFPEDVHAPAISSVPFRKLIVKARC